MIFKNGLNIGDSNQLFPPATAKGSGNENTDNLIDVIHFRNLFTII